MSEREFDGIEHERCEHGICLKCEPCGLCIAARLGKQAAIEAVKEFLADEPAKGAKCVNAASPAAND